MIIKKQLVSENIANKRTFGKGNIRKYLTVHQTGNTRAGANAQAHANLLSRGGIVASWHWTVDDKMAIQSYDHSYKCWHAGDGRKAGNTQSIGGEICINSDGNYIQALKNAAKLFAGILKDENIPIQNMVQHNYWSGKDCPKQIRAGKNGINWSKFVEMVKSELGSTGTINVTNNATKSNKKTVSQVASEVIKGLWGNGASRKQRLEKAGYNFADVQSEVNRLLGVKVRVNKKSVNTIADEVIRGLWGNGADRKRRIQNAGYNYSEVQRLVNQKLR